MAKNATAVKHDETTETTVNKAADTNANATSTNANAASNATSTNGTTKAGKPRQRPEVSSIVYLDASDTEHNHADGTTVALKISFANGYSDITKLSDLPQEMANAAMAQGLASRFQRSFQAVKGDINDAVERFTSAKENILSGKWIAPRGGDGKGPRPSLLAQAVEAILIEDGESVDENRRKGIVEKLRSDEMAEAVMKNPRVVAKYKSLQAEAALARANEAAKKAQEANTEETKLSAF